MGSGRRGATTGRVGHAGTGSTPCPAGRTGQLPCRRPPGRDGRHRRRAGTRGQRPDRALCGGGARRDPARGGQETGPAASIPPARGNPGGPGGGKGSTAVGGGRSGCTVGARRRCRGGPHSRRPTGAGTGRCRTRTRCQLSRASTLSTSGTAAIDVSAAHTVRSFHSAAGEPCHARAQAWIGTARRRTQALIQFFRGGGGRTSCAFLRGAAWACSGMAGRMGPHFTFHSKPSLFPAARSLFLACMACFLWHVRGRHCVVSCSKPSPRRPPKQTLCHVPSHAPHSPLPLFIMGDEEKKSPWIALLCPVPNRECNAT